MGWLAIFTERFGKKKAEPHGFLLALPLFSPLFGRGVFPFISVDKAWCLVIKCRSQVGAVGAGWHPSFLSKTFFQVKSNMALPSIRKAVVLSPKMSINEAFAAILRHNFDDMLSWIPVAYNREDIEGVHQVRVALRRLRSAISVFRKAIPRSITDPWNEEMRWVAGEFGLTRDLDVLIDEGLEGVAGKIPMPKLLPGQVVGVFARPTPGKLVSKPPAPPP